MVFLTVIAIAFIFAAYISLGYFIAECVYAATDSPLLGIAALLFWFAVIPISIAQFSA